MTNYFNKYFLCALICIEMSLIRGYFSVTFTIILFIYAEHVPYTKSTADVKLRLNNDTFNAMPSIDF